MDSLRTGPLDFSWGIKYLRLMEHIASINMKKNKLTPMEWAELDLETKLRLKHGWDEFSPPIKVDSSETVHKPLTSTPV